MMYPFMTLDDDTEIVHSEMKPDGRVKVYLEKPDAEDCFHSAVCWLPGYDWQEVHGFTPEEIARYQKIVESTSRKICYFCRTVENTPKALRQNDGRRAFLRLWAGLGRFYAPRQKAPLPRVTVYADSAGNRTNSPPESGGFL